MSPKDDEFPFDGELHFDGSAAVLSYRVQNTSSARDLVLLNRVYGRRGEEGPDFAYVTLDRSARRVAVWKGYPKAPKGETVGFVFPGHVRLSPGGAFAEAVRLRVPVEAFDAYRDNVTARSPDAHVELFEEFTFGLDVAWIPGEPTDPLHPNGERFRERRVTLPAWKKQVLVVLPNVADH